MDDDKVAGLPVLEHTVTHIGEREVEGASEPFEPVVGMAEKITRYDRLVEDAVAELVCDSEGIPKDMTARVIASKALDGVPQLHIFGRNAEAVDAVADGVRSRTREVYRHYIGNRVDPAEEAATIRPMLTDILKNMPATIGKPEDILAEARGLPLIDAAAKALQEFNKGGQEDDTKE
ncbi:unnamed protein product [marine sediment metagenome]|uniref:Uncharacterized protein n=1 Tax=marine sediment metagenome TaxID=412755 RepID=X1Q980_9ZZZZ